MNNAPIEGGRDPDAEALAAQMERMIEQVARDPALGALAEYYGDEVLPEDLGARLRALQTIAHGHWDRRGQNRAAGGGGMRQDVDHAKPDAELDAGADALTVAAASSQGLRESSPPLHEDPDVLMVPGGANWASYDRLRYGLANTTPHEVVMATGGRTLRPEERAKLIDWAQGVTGQDGAALPDSGLHPSLHADIRRWAAAENDTRLTEGDLAKAALMRASLENEAGKVANLRQVQVQIGPDAWGGTANPISAVVYTYTDGSSGTPVDRNAVVIETPANVHRVDGTIGTPTTYENMAAFLALYGAGRGRTVELVTTALFMYQGLPALGVLGPAGWQVHGFGHDAVFSGVVKPGEDRPPAQYRQEFVALIDAAAQLRQMQAQPPSIFLA